VAVVAACPRKPSHTSDAVGTPVEGGLDPFELTTLAGVALGQNPTACDVVEFNPLAGNNSQKAIEALDPLFHEVKAWLDR